MTKYKADQLVVIPKEVLENLIEKFYGGYWNEEYNKSLGLHLTKPLTPLLTDAFKVGFNSQHPRIKEYLNKEIEL